MDGWTDGVDCVTFLSNAVGNKLKHRKYKQLKQKNLITSLYAAAERAWSS